MLNEASVEDSVPADIVDALIKSRIHEDYIFWANVVLWTLYPLCFLNKI